MITTIALLVTAPAAFKCAIDTSPRKAISADGKTTVVALYTGKIMIYRGGGSKPAHISSWSQFGHHQELKVKADGSAFAIYDVYGGMEVFDGTGKKIAFLDPTKELTANEMKDIPGKWTCHTEGTWLVEPKLEFAEYLLSFNLYNGRKITVPLPG